MGKLGIITFYDTDNYGAVLQAYALQSTIQNMGHTAEFVRFYDETAKQAAHASGMRDYYKILKNSNYNLYGYLKTYALIQLVAQKFDFFREKYMNVSRIAYYSMEQLQTANQDYMGFVCGSDMIWSDIGQNMDVFFLQFAQPGTRISYAPSLTGINTSDKKELTKLKKRLEGIDFLSCREKFGVDIITELTGKKAFHALDPTLLMTKDMWKKHLQFDTKDRKNKYILCYMFGGAPNSVIRELKTIGKKLNADIRYIPMSVKERSYELQNGRTAAYGPYEFVELFYNADFVITNSYHGLLFSLIFEKPFVLFHREHNCEWSIHEERMNSILSITGLSNRFLGIGEHISNSLLYLDYTSGISSSLGRERKKSLLYLKNAIEAVESHNAQTNNSPDSKPPKNIGELEPNKCTGCSACAALCPTNCISMAENTEGFLYPAIDMRKCIDCGLCVQKCPSFYHPKLIFPTKTYLGYGKGEEISDSASGGIFITIAQYIIKEKQGIVFGAILESGSFKCRHVSAHTISELPPMQNSKYIQSEIGNTYQECKTYLTQGMIVLFTGTPCQIAGLNTFLGKKYDTLYTMDIICHGVPSQKFFDASLNGIKDKYGSNLLTYKFRNKLGKEHKQSSYEAVLSYGSDSIKIPSDSEPYYRSFIQEFSYRESCYQCVYAQESRVGDITIGDCDSRKEYKDFDITEHKSTILINTPQGQNLWQNTEKLFQYRILDFEQETIINHPLRRPSKRQTIRNEIYIDLLNLPWREFAEKYGKPKTNFLKKVAIKLIRMLN